MPMPPMSFPKDVSNVPLPVKSDEAREFELQFEISPTVRLDPAPSKGFGELAVAYDWVRGVNRDELTAGGTGLRLQFRFPQQGGPARRPIRQRIWCMLAESELVKVARLSTGRVSVRGRDMPSISTEEGQ